MNSLGLGLESASSAGLVSQKHTEKETRAHYTRMLTHACTRELITDTCAHTQTPWIFPPGQPLHGRGMSGNKRVWLRWDAPHTDGGRKIEGFELWISNASGLARVPPVWWRLHLVPTGNVTTGVNPPSGKYPISQVLRRRRASMLKGGAGDGGGARTSEGSADDDVRGDAWSGREDDGGDGGVGGAHGQSLALRKVASGGGIDSGLQDPPVVNQQRSAEGVGDASDCRVDCHQDPRSLTFLVTGDADLQPLREVTYSFRVRSKNSYDVSRWSERVCARTCRRACIPCVKLILCVMLGGITHQIVMSHGHCYSMFSAYCRTILLLLQ
jgi:hypothetical protein